MFSQWDISYYTLKGKPSILLQALNAESYRALCRELFPNIFGMLIKTQLNTQMARYLTDAGAAGAGADGVQIR